MTLKDTWAVGEVFHATDQNQVATQVNTNTAAISGKQDGDSDLSAIAGLSPSNDDVIQRKAGAWTNRTAAQLKSDLSLNNVTNNAQYYAGGTDVALGDGGTGASLTDPNADRIMFWDDSAGAVTWLTPGTGLTITSTTIDAAGGGSGDMVLASAQTVTGAKTFNAGKLLDKGSIVYDVRAYGAVGNGTTDDTTAINNTVTAASSGGIVFFPPGTYKITSVLNWKINGLVVMGAGSNVVNIQQATSNTGIIKVAGSHQTIGGLKLSYAAQRPNTETSAIGIGFGDNTVGSSFGSRFYDLYIYRAATGMAMNPEVSTIAGLFSCVFENIHILAYSISAINLQGANGTGNANATGCVFTNIYTQNDTDATTCNDYPVLMRDWDEFIFNQLNVEHGTVGAKDLIALIGVGVGVFNSLHIEAVTMPSGSNGFAALYVSNSKAFINGGTCRFCTFAGSASNPLFRFFGTSPKLTVNGWRDSSNTVTTASRPAVDLGSATGVRAYLSCTDLAQTTARRTGGDSSCTVVFSDDSTPRIGTTASSGTPSINADLYDQYNITALAAAITSVTVTGTPVDGQRLRVRIKDNGTLRAVAWGSSFVAGPAALLSTTAASKTHLSEFAYDSAAAKWACTLVHTAGY